MIPDHGPVGVRTQSPVLGHPSSTIVDGEAPMPTEVR